MSRTTTMLVFFLALAALAHLPACSTETLDPLMRPASNEPTDGGVDAKPPPDDAAPPGPVKRTVSIQNPFGASPDNLMIDGDFELSLAPESHSGQYGWRAFSDTAETSMRVETGGMCRSGLRCGIIEEGMLFLGRGAAAPLGAGHVASVFVKPPPGEVCGVVKVSLIGCHTFNVIKKLTAEEQPDAQGWCEHTATAPTQDSAICMYVDGSALKQPALIDSAVLLPDDGKAQAAGTMWNPNPGEAKRLASVRERVRRSTRFGPAPRSAPPKSRPQTP